jgi:copper/silver efflux system protein
VINRIIEWCARNRFLVFTGTLLLVMTGIWSIGHIPLDALPDISDVQVIIHTNWESLLALSSLPFYFTSARL